METADHYLNALPSELLAAASRGEIELNEWLLLCWLAVGPGENGSINTRLSQLYKKTIYQA